MPGLISHQCPDSNQLQVYKLYSELISKTIAEGGPYAARSTFVKYMRSVKKVALKLIEVCATVSALLS